MMFIPDGKILLENIKKELGNVGKEGVVPSKLVTLTDCSSNKTGNKRDNCYFCFSSQLTALLGLMLQRMVSDGEARESFSFLSLNDQLVVCIGFNESDLDFIVT